MSDKDIKNSEVEVSKTEKETIEKTPEERAFFNKIRKRLTTMALLSVIILTGIVMVFTIPQVIVMAIDISKGETVEDNIFIALLLTAAAEITTIFIALWAVYGLKDWKNLLMLKNFKWKPVVMGLLIGIVMFGLLQVVSYILTSMGATIESSDTSTGIAGLTGWQGVLSIGLLTPIIIPFIEEVFFRGYILNFMRNGIGEGKKRLYWSVFVSVFFFTIMHFQGLSGADDVLVLVWVGIIAFINCLLVIKYDSLYPAVAVHIGYNGITSLIMVFATSLV